MNQNALNLLYAFLNYEEGYKEIPYHCSEGYPTVAIGWKIGPKNAPLEMYKDIFISKPVAKALLADRVEYLINKLMDYGWFATQNDDRKIVLVSMAYQMGRRRLLGFNNMIEALSGLDFEKAKDEAIDSLWFKQTENRAQRHADVLGCGSISEVYGDRLKDFYL